MRTSYLFCEECLLTIELIDPQDRCTLCFQEKGEAPCKHENRDRRFFREGALFVERSAAEALLFDLSRHRKLLASYFLIQWTNLHWPTFETIIPSKGWEKVAHELQALFPSSEVEKDRVLFIGERKGTLHMKDPFSPYKNYSLTLF